MIDKKIIVPLLIKHEGLKLKPYRDTVGKLTIGIGRNLDDVGISRIEAVYLCSNNIDQCFDDLRKNFSWFNILPDNAQLVLVDMCFNMGIGKLLTFKNTLLLIQNGKYEEASISMLQSKWATQVGNRAIEDSNLLKQCTNEFN